MSNSNNNEIRAAKREYYREWRKKNPDRVAQTQERYWSRKAAEMRSRKTSADQRNQTGCDD